MKEQKVFIYCRVLSNRARSLLNYQEDILTDFAKDMGMKIKAIAKDVSEGKYLIVKVCKNLFTILLMKR
mgnify:FL=1